MMMMKTELLRTPKVLGLLRFGAIFTFLFIGLYALTSVQEKDEATVIFESELLQVSEASLGCQYSENFKKNFIAFSFKNKSDKEIEVTFKKGMKYTGKCLSCDAENQSDLIYSLKLEPNEILIPDCSSDDIRLLSIIKSLNADTPTDSELEAYELKVLTVNQITK
jgi:hypothetical protein